MTNVSTDRFGSFFERLETERRALKIVNLAFIDSQLHGLTEAALQAWLNESMQVSAECIERKHLVFPILIRLSSRIDALADQSRTVFAGEGGRVLSTVHILSELESACSATA